MLIDIIIKVNVQNNEKYFNILILLQIKRKVLRFRVIFRIRMSFQ